MQTEYGEGGRMYDRLLARGFEFPPHLDKKRGRSESQQVMGLLETAQVFNIQNVADYFYSYSGKRLQDWTIGDFPRVAPPFESFFTEFRILPIHHSSLLLSSEGIPPYAVGILSRTVDCSDEGTTLRTAIHSKTGDENIEYGEAKWLMSSAVFLEWRKWQKPEVPALFYVPIKPNGEPFVEQRKPGILGRDYSDYLDKKEDIPDQETEEFLGSVQPYFLPTLLALSFLHCKGVTVEQNPPAQKLSRVFQKRHGRPLVTFHTLNIDPMRKIIETEGQVQKLGLKRALHIVRGHFADFSERGLFGRHKDIYWFEQHLKGSLEEGLALKDYNVNSAE